MFVGNLCVVCGLFVVYLWAEKNKSNDFKGLVIKICGQFVRCLWSICDQFVICAFSAMNTIRCCAKSLYFGYTLNNGGQRMSMGSILNQYIHDHFKNRRAFCEDIGFRESTVSNWCNDRATIPLSKIAIMAEYFHDLTGEPPNLFIFRIVMQEPTIRAVLSSFQQRHRGRK